MIVLIVGRLCRNSDCIASQTDDDDDHGVSFVQMHNGNSDAQQDRHNALDGLVEHLENRSFLLADFQFVVKMSPNTRVNSDASLEYHLTIICILKQI